MYYEEKTHFVIGSAIDVLLTQPELFDDLYYVDQMENKPSDKIMSICKEFFDEICPDNPKDMIHKAILKACDNHAYQTNWKAATRVEKILKEGSDYLAHLEMAEDKQILSKEEYFLIGHCALSLQANEATAPYLHGVQQRLWQEAIYFTYRNISCKALLDLVIIDHERKTVLPVDIKSTGEYPENFKRSAKRFRYDVQAAWYTLALATEYPDYEILPFTFIVVSVKDPSHPLVYECTEDDLIVGRYGMTIIDFAKTIVGEEEDEIEIDVMKKIKGFEDGVSYYLAQQASGLDYPWDLKQFSKRKLSLWTE